jgi:serine/threonine protein kinase
VYAVLADFGISRILSSTMLLVEAFEIANVDGVSVSYAAPEVLRKLTSHVSSNALSSVNSDIIRAGDVYSFSMVAYEVINRQQPWSKSRSSTEVIARVLRGERPQLTAEVIGKKSFDKKLAGLCEIMQQCWVDDPMARLQMKWIIEILEQVQNSSVTRI